MGPVGPIALQPLTREDVGLLHRWLLAPHVRAWWGGAPPTPEDVAREYEPSADARTRVFTLRLDGRPVGMLQCYRQADYPEWDRDVGVPDAAGIDFLIGEADCCGRGVGTAAIALFSAAVFDLYPEVRCIVSVPQQANRASRRALEKAGFQLVGERELQSEHPSDAGTSAVYVLCRPG